MQKQEPVSRVDWPTLIAASELSPTTKLVALLMATYADPDGTRVSPGVKQLAWASGLAPDTVGKKLRALRRTGYLQRMRGHAPGRCDTYRLTKPAPAAGPSTPPLLDA